MFAVPGWNVSAAIATQTEVPKPKDPNKLGKKAQKRKLRQEEQQVNAENFVEQWERRFGNEGDGKRASEEAVKEGVVAGKDKNVGVDADVDAEALEKRGKKRKRGKPGGRKDGREGGGVISKGEGEVATQAVQAENGESSSNKDSAKAADGTSKREKKKRKKDQDSNLQANGAEKATAPALTAAVDLLPEPKGLTPLQKSMRSKLASARFRHLNESLYTKPSAESLTLFRDDPSMFDDYHRGFAQQVDVWPENPVDGYVASIVAKGKIRTKDPWKEKKRQEKKGKPGSADVEADAAVVPAKGDAKPLPRNIKGHCTIADLGCGTASLSYRLQAQLKPLNLTLHSFDLSKPSGPSAPLVTVADISALPLADNTVDVAIFCLALMGTNWLDFIDEAYRVLRWRGELWISEIKSRFGRVEGRKAGKPPVNSVGSLRKRMDGKDKKKKNQGSNNKGGEGDDEGIADSADEAELAVTVDGAAAAKEGTDVTAFTAVLRRRGFVLDALPERPQDAIDLRNKMFVKMHFVKAAHPSAGKNARPDQKAGAGAQPGGLKMGLKGKKFGAIAGRGDGDGDKDGVSAEKEMKVLKPCLYKIR